MTKELYDGPETLTFRVSGGTASQTRIRAELVHIHPYSSWAPSVFPPSRNTESQNIEAQLLRRIVGWNKKKEAIDPGAPSPPLLFFFLSVCLFACARACVCVSPFSLFVLVAHIFLFFTYLLCLSGSPVSSILAERSASPHFFPL